MNDIENICSCLRSCVRLYNTLKMVLWYFAYGIETMWLNIMFT